MIVLGLMCDGCRCSTRLVPLEPGDARPMTLQVGEAMGHLAGAVADWAVLPDDRTVCPKCRAVLLKTVAAA